MKFGLTYKTGDAERAEGLGSDRINVRVMDNFIHGEPQP